ncbi:MAG: preprotein translocase subunit YajC [Phycisphaerales bacterium]
MAIENIMPSAWIFPATLQDSPGEPQMLGSESTTQPGTDPGAGGSGAEVPPAGGSNIFFFLIIFTVGMFLFMSLSGRKEKKRRAQMLASLGKRDKVRTAGGIIGTVIEIKNDEVLLETDRSSNTRLWLSRGSISAVITSAGKPAQDQAADATPETEPVA